MHLQEVSTEPPKRHCILFFYFVITRYGHCFLVITKKHFDIKNNQLFLLVTKYYLIVIRKSQWFSCYTEISSHYNKNTAIKSLFSRKQLASYVACSDKTINLNLVHHPEPNGSTKGKFSNRNQETNICLYLYPGTCTQVHVWLNVLLFIPLLYYMLLFFFNVTLRS